MRNRYRIREIAAQAGLSAATVDRVLHDRPGVRESTALEVRQAIADLDRQRTQVRLAGRTFMIDVMVQAPARFSAAIRAALEAELPGLRPAVIHARFHLIDGTSSRDAVAVLGRVARSASHGLILKAPDVPEIVAAAGRVPAPLVTLVTDLPTTRRIAYAGQENVALLRERKISAVLHHDLRVDLRRACHAILQANGVLSGPVRTNPSAIQVITPHNAPPVEF